MLDLDACAGKPPQAAPNPVHRDVDRGSAAAEHLLLDACGVWRSRAQRPTRQAGKPTVSPIRGVPTRPGVPGHARLTQKADSGLTPPFHRKKLSPEVRLSNSTGKRRAAGRFAACRGATPSVTARVPDREDPPDSRAHLKNRKGRRRGRLRRPSGWGDGQGSSRAPFSFAVARGEVRCRDRGSVQGRCLQARPSYPSPERS